MTVQVSTVVPMIHPVPLDTIHRDRKSRMDGTENRWVYRGIAVPSLQGQLPFVQ
jgi:hypothetical protein